MEQLNAFIEKIESDNELEAKIKALGEKANQPDEIIALAAEYGFTVTTDDIEQLKNCAGCSGMNGAGKNGELSEEALEAVAGGGRTKNRYSSDCDNTTRLRDECKGYHILGGFLMPWCDHYSEVGFPPTLSCSKVGWSVTLTLPPLHH